MKIVVNVSAGGILHSNTETRADKLSEATLLCYADCREASKYTRRVARKPEDRAKYLAELT